MDPIVGTPEGRDGIWLVTPETAARLLADVPGDMVHNLLSDGGLCLFGAYHQKAAAIASAAMPGLRWALVFPPYVTMKHQLVALSDAHRSAYDVGEIAEPRMTNAEQGKGLMPRAQSGSVP